MANLNIRMDDELRNEVHDYFKSVGITPTEAVRGLYEYIQTTGQMPFNRTYLSSEDAELLRLAKEALSNDDEIVNVKPRDLRAALQL